MADFRERRARFSCRGSRTRRTLAAWSSSQDDGVSSIEYLSHRAVARASFRSTCAKDHVSWAPRPASSARRLFGGLLKVQPPPLRTWPMDGAQAHLSVARPAYFIPGGPGRARPRQTSLMPLMAESRVRPTTNLETQEGKKRSKVKPHAGRPRYSHRLQPSSAPMMGLLGSSLPIPDTRRQPSWGWDEEEDLARRRPGVVGKMADPSVDAGLRASRARAAWRCRCGRRPAHARKAVARERHQRRPSRLR